MIPIRLKSDELSLNLSFLRLLFLVLTLLCWTNNSTGVTGLSTSEYNALWSLYNSTNGNQWRWRTIIGSGNKWEFKGSTNNPCSQNWQGVTCECNKNTCTVKQLDLEGYALNGEIPNSISALSGIQHIILSINDLIGSIPASIGTLTSLEYLELFSNRLSGTIPSSLGNLLNLELLLLSTNHLTGTIPSSLGNLSNLQALELFNNHLNGTIPSSLGNMSDLLYLYLYTNHLTGSIPSYLGNLSSLQYLELSTNHLTGTIPPSLGKLSNLLILNLYINHLAGSIPSSLCNMPKLRYLDLNYNHLNGTLPSSLGNLPSLQYLVLNSNDLTGTIPSSLSNLLNLTIFVFSSNHLNGTIPPSLGKLSRLQYFILSNNHLTGSIPSSLGNMSHLLYLYLHSNNIGGTVPTSFSNLSNLVSLRVQNNRLSGNFPAFPATMELVELKAQNNSLFGDIVVVAPNVSVIDLSSNRYGNRTTQQVILPCGLRYLNLSSNQLSGPIAQFINPGLSALVSIDMSSNHLTGNVGALFARFSNLSSLLLSGNQLEGNIGELLDGNSQLSLQSIDISLNRFTGSIPAEWFHPPNISSIVVSSNCITGSLPNRVCYARNLVTLVLDGMGSSTSCITPLLGSWSNGIYILEDTSSRLDSCLFQSLPLLQTLHLSGINLEGSIPSVQSLPSRLQYLSLSNNHLTGVIPKVFYQHDSWIDLDLSFNQLTGVLEPFVSTNASLELTQNRLSGSIPFSMVGMLNVSILSGNIFSCDYERRSNQLPQYDSEAHTYLCGSNELDIILFVWLSICCLGFILVLSYPHYKDIASELLKSMFDDHEKHSGFILGKLTYMCSVVAITCVFILLPMYCLLKLHYGTYAHQYAYTVSSGYIGGVAPSVVLLIVYFLLLGACVYLLRPKLFSDSYKKKSGEHNYVDSGTSKLWIGFSLISFLSVSSTTVFNVLYVYALVMQLGQKINFALVLSLSLIKLACTQLLLQSSHMISSESTTYITTALLCFNNVVVPYLGEAFVSGNCFLYATFRAVPIVSSVISLHSCGILFDPDVFYYNQLLPSTHLYCLPTDKSISYQPPFNYNYSCSASLLSNFAGVFILRFLTSGYIIPLIQWTVSRQLQHYYSKDNDNKMSVFHKILLILEDKRWHVCRLMSNAASTSTECLDDNVRHLSIQSVYDRRKFVPSLLSDMLVLLSFGVMYPPLAVVIWISVIVHVRTQQLVLQAVEQYVQQCSTEVREEYLSRLQDEMGMTATLVRYSTPAMLCFTGAFWSLTLFDTLGGAVGAARASSVVVVMCACPFVWYGVLWFMDSYRVSSNTGGGEEHGKDSLPSYESSTTTTGNPIHRRLSAEIELPEKSI